jgi:hypothetical protein
MYREFLDSREGFDSLTREEYNDYLDSMEEEAALAQQEDDDYELDDFEHDFAPEDDFDGQPDEYTEWQDYMGGDDWDHGQFDCEY